MSNLSTADRDFSAGLASLVEDTAENGTYVVKVESWIGHRDHILEPSDYLANFHFPYSPVDVICCHECRVVLVQRPTA